MLVPEPERRKRGIREIFHPENQRSLLLKKKKPKQPHLFCHLKPSSLVASPPVHLFHPIKESLLKRSTKAVSFQSNNLPAWQSRNFFKTKPYLFFPLLPSNQIYHLFQCSRCTNLCISLATLSPVGKASFRSF